MGLAIKEGFKRDELIGRCTLFCLGVDVRWVAGNGISSMYEKFDARVSIWFDECSAIMLKSGLHGQLGENPQLQIFLYKLCFLLWLPVDMLFVFDGSRRPSRKQG